MGHRFFYQNLIGAGTAIAASSAAPGFVGGAVPRVANGPGSAVFSGSYAGEDQEVYTVEIDAEGDAGAATFKWRKTSTPAGAWEASGVPTAATDTLLEAGVNVRFTNGAPSPALKVGDRWQATASRFRSPRKIHDLDLATRWRSASPPADPETLTFDLGSPQAPDALILHGHNLSAGAAVRIQANSSDAWGAPPVDEAVTWRAGTMHRYLTTAPRSYRYWRLLIGGEAGNPDGHAELAEVYLGGFFEPAFNYAWRNLLEEEALEARRETESGVEKTVLLNRGRRALLPYRHVAAAERDLFLAMFRAVKDKDNERSRPLFAHLDVDDPASLLFAALAGRFSPVEEGPDDFSFELELRERLT